MADGHGTDGAAPRTPHFVRMATQNLFRWLINRLEFPDFTASRAQRNFFKKICATSCADKGVLVLCALKDPIGSSLNVSRSVGSTPWEAETGEAEVLAENLGKQTQPCLQRRQKQKTESRSPAHGELRGSKRQGQRGQKGNEDEEVDVLSLGGRCRRSDGD